MKSWGLQTRLITLVLTPTVLLTLGLCAFVALARYQGLETIQDEHDRILLEKYCFAIDDQIRSASPSSVAPTINLNLQKQATAALDEPGLRSFTLLGEGSRSLLHSGPQLHSLQNGQALQLNNQVHRYLTDNSWLYVRPLDISMQGKDGLSHPAWVMLEFDTDALQISKYKSLLLVSALSLGVLVFMSILLVWLVRRWLAPVSDMTEALRMLDSEHLDNRLNTKASGDLQDLEFEINALLYRLSTDTKELQSSMLQANKDLHETMEAMEVQNIELTLARKEAVEGNRIKSEFLANISHEVRTPLNGIIGFAKLLLKTQISPRQLDYIKTIQKSSDSLLAIINDVLDLSKIEAGKLVLDHMPIDIEEIIFDVLSMLAPLAEEKDLEQVAIINADVPHHLMGDPLRIKQILTNLVNNAIKFTPKGEIIVRCMLENLSDHYATLRISVSDTGIGLSDSARADLFHAFSQGGPSTARKFGGTGLGLVISKYLVEQMQGEISFENNNGEGTTFWFTLRAALDPHNSGDCYSYGDHGYGDHLKHRHIIVAEPHAASRQSLVDVLSRWGVRSTPVESLEAIYETLRSDSPDTLLIARSLLGSRNAAGRTRIEELQHQINCPILLLSRSSDTVEEQMIHQRNALISVIAKPVVPRELYTQLVQMFPDPSLQPAQQPLPLSRQSPMPRVLVVDDNPANLKLVCILLNDLQIDTVPATDGYQAIRLCQEQSFDLVLMDIQMPGLSGLEATQVIRRHEQGSSGKRLPIVALTAHAMSNEREALLKSGMDDYLTKPVQEAHLAYILTKWTGREPRNSAIGLLPDTAAANSRASVVVNWQESLRLAASKKDLARDMLTMLLNSLEQEKRKIGDAYDDNNMDSLLSYVHYLHGATRYCGVPALRDAVQVLEISIKSQINLYQTKLNEGSETEKPHTRHCQKEVNHLLHCIDQLIEWRENNALPA